MSDLLQQKIEAKLARLAEQSLVRRRQVVNQVISSEGSQIYVDDKAYINFSSNDYLGLAHQPFMAAAFHLASDQYGVGSGSSPLVTGYQPIHQDLEQCLCDMTGHEAAILFSSGFSANHGLIDRVV